MNTFLQLSLLKNPGAIKATILMLVVTFIIVFFFKDLKRVIGKKRKEFIVYILGTLLLFSGVALLTNDKVFNDVPLNKFIGIQILFFLVGTLHFFAERRYFSELSVDSKKMASELAFGVLVGCIGLIAFIYVANLNQPSYTMLYLAGVLWFLVPFLIVKCYEFTLVIPLPIYKKWLYPLDQRIDDPKDEELVNPLVISFEFDRSLKINETSNFRLKAPEKMEFGRLFYFFINDYNEKHPEHKIEYTNNENAPFGWIFYKKPKWFRPMKYIDFNRTIDGNSIKEDDVIICKRA